MSVSPMLEYFVSRMEGLSVSHMRLEVQNQSSNIGPQSIIRVTLPQNALLSIPSLAFHFNMKATGTLTGTKTTRLPNGIDTILNRVSVSIGGQDIASGANFYGVLSRAREVIEGCKLDAGCEHPEIIGVGADNNYVDGTALVANEAPVSTNNSAQFAIKSWNGFLGSCEPAVMSTDLVSDIVVTLFLEQASNCLTGSDNIDSNANFISNTAIPLNYELNNVYFTIKAFSLANGIVDNLYAQQMSQGNLEMGFKQYFSFRDTNSGSTRFSIASQSINKIIVAHQPTPSPANPAPVKVVGYNGVVTGTNVKNLDLGKIKYIHPTTNFSEPATTSKNLYEWQLNGSKYPMFRATAEDLLLIARQANGAKADLYDKNMGLRQYKANYFVACMDLTMDAPNARYLQGLDVRSSSLSAYYNTYNESGSTTKTIFVECGSSLFIAPGKQVAIVQ